MSDINETPAKRRSWPLWVIGIAALLWNSIGAMDFVMTQTKNEAYMKNFTPEQLDFFYGFPAWVVTTWGIAVWGGVLGALLLLFRKRLAVWVFLASLIAMVTTTFHNYVLADGMKVMGDTSSLIFTAVIFLIALALLLYAIALQKRAILV